MRVNDIKPWLYNLLKDGAISSGVVYKMAKSKGIPHVKLQIAAWYLGVKKFREAGVWRWKLPYVDI